MVYIVCHVLNAVSMNEAWHVCSFRDCCNHFKIIHFRVRWVIPRAIEWVHQNLWSKMLGLVDYINNCQMDDIYIMVEFSILWCTSRYFFPRKSGPWLVYSKLTYLWFKTLNSINGKNLQSVIFSEINCIIFNLKRTTASLHIISWMRFSKVWSC